MAKRNLKREIVQSFHDLKAWSVLICGLREASIGYLESHESVNVSGQFLFIKNLVRDSAKRIWI
jgi:hypothetical protein